MKALIKSPLRADDAGTTKGTCVKNVMSITKYPSEPFCRAKQLKWTQPSINNSGIFSQGISNERLERLKLSRIAYLIYWIRLGKCVGSAESARWLYCWQNKSTESKFVHFNSLERIMDISIVRAVWGGRVQQRVFQSISHYNTRTRASFVLRILTSNSKCNQSNRFKGAESKEGSPSGLSSRDFKTDAIDGVSFQIWTLPQKSGHHANTVNLMDW